MPKRGASGRALERLEAEITELWGHINAATYRFLELVGEHDAREGHTLHGMATCAQWLGWQCGMGAVAAREKVRIAQACASCRKSAMRSGAVSCLHRRRELRITYDEDGSVVIRAKLPPELGAVIKKAHREGHRQARGRPGCRLDRDRV